MTKRLRKPKEGRCKVCGSDCASLHEFCGGVNFGIHARDVTKRQTGPLDRSTKNQKTLDSLASLLYAQNMKTAENWLIQRTCGGHYRLAFDIDQESGTMTKTSNIVENGSQVSEEPKVSSGDVLETVSGSKYKLGSPLFPWSCKKFRESKGRV